MMSKKAQSEIITTVLIILLVLAAIIIVWQVVMGVLNQGKTSVTEQQGCIGFSMNVAVTESTPNTVVNLIPNKLVSGVRVYAAGAVMQEKLGNVDALSSTTVTNTTFVSTGKEITTAGKIGEVWCPGANSVTP